MLAALIPVLLANGAAAELTGEQVQEAVGAFTGEWRLFSLSRPPGDRAASRSAAIPPSSGAV